MGTSAAQLSTEQRHKVPQNSGQATFFGAGRSGATGKQRPVKDFLKGALIGDFCREQTAAGTLGQISLGMIPVIGQAADARDTAAALQGVAEKRPGRWLSLGVSLLGWIPLVGDALKGAKRGMFAAGDLAGTALRRQADDLTSAVTRKLSYEPKIVADSHLPAGTGETDKYGNVWYSTAGTKGDQVLAYHHEMVHSFFSPKLDALREFRADLRMSAYEKSSLVRYLEEAVAESYAQLKVNGLAGLAEGLRFPIANGYVELRDVLTEAAIGTVVVGTSSYGVYLALEP